MGGNICRSYDGHLISRIYKEVFKDSDLKMIKGLDISPKKTYKGPKSTSAPLVIKEIPINATIRYHFTLTRMALIQKNPENNEFLVRIWSK